MSEQLQVKIYSEAEFNQFESDFSDMLKTLDIYYQPSFLLSDARMQKGKAEVFTCIDSISGDSFIYPYIRISISKSDFEDLTSPYGYAGPYSTSAELFKQAEQKFISYCKEQGFVTEFIRYHYLYNDELKFSVDCKNIENRTVVLLDLTIDKDDIWMRQFSSTNRNLVRKLEKDEFQWKIKPFERSDIKAFQKIYAETMSNASADDFYLFSDDFYLDLIKGLKNDIQICWVEKSDEIYAMSLLFTSGGIATYFLSGRNINYPKISSTNFLLSEIAFWAKENNCILLNFGGGLSLSKDDRLFKFKQNFSKTEKSFYIGKRIHNIQAYESLTDEFIQKHGSEKYQNVKHILQFYHQ